MAVRNLKSVEREAAPDPANLLEIVRGAHWEIRSLLHEMQEILTIPTAVYELYPRIRIALELHERGEEGSLYRALLAVPEGARLAEEATAAHRTIEARLRRLDEKPWRHEQIRSQAWKLEFLGLHDSVLRHLEWEEREVLPLVRERVADLDRWGSCYGAALGEETT